MRIILLLVLFFIATTPLFADEESYLTLDVEDETVGYAHYIRGGIHERQGELDAAIEEYKQAAARDKFATVPYLCLARCYLKKRAYKQAEQVIKHVIELRPEKISAHFLLATIYTMQGKLEEAITEYKKILETSPRNLSALATLTDLCLIKGRTEEAVFFYEKAAAGEDVAPGIYLNLGVL